MKHRTMFFQLLAMVVTGLAHAAPATPDPATPPAGAARMAVFPSEVTAGTYQQLRFVFTVGPEQIGIGGGVRFELPVAYLETAPYYWDPPQTTLPDGRGYVWAEASRKAPLTINISGSRNGIIECVTTGRRLKKNDRITIHYAGVVQSLTWPLLIPVQWRASESDPWQDLAQPVAINIKAQPAATMTLVLPADAVRGQGFSLAVSMLDKFGNRATGYRGRVIFTSTDPQARIPQPYAFTAQDSGVHLFKHVSFGTLGYQRVDASDGRLTGHTHYSEVFETAPAYRRYFGETHFHTGTGTGNRHFTARGGGGDHRGHFTSQEHAYRYIRDVMRLDFASASEHDSPLLDQAVWDRSQAIADAFNEPGRFTTFFAYEWTAGPREGHHVVLYKNRGSQMLGRSVYPTKPELWAAFDRQDQPTIMIPHPMWAQPDHGIFDQVNNRYRKLGEIYSIWNSRYLLQPGIDAQRFETGADSPWTFQYAWSRGHRIGVIGSSDNHTGHPGANNYTAHTEHAGGLAVALAKGNTRDKLWDALEHRRTYATSGTRILLTFSADGHPMGAEYRSGTAPVLAVRVAGTRQLAQVDLVKHDSRGYRVLYSEQPEGDIAIFQYTDNDFTEDSMYYLRVTQVNETPTGPWAYANGEMAWSSPIWIEFTP